MNPNSGDELSMGVNSVTLVGRAGRDPKVRYFESGSMVAGGGALVRGISDLISHETGIFVHIAEDPLLCVVNGCGQVLEDWKRLQRVVDTPEFVRAAAGV